MASLSLAHCSCVLPRVSCFKSINRHGSRSCNVSSRLSSNPHYRIGHTCTLNFPIIRALPEAELPSELLEDAKFVPLNNDVPQFGPPAVLLIGISYPEVVKVQEFLQKMGGDFLKVIICTKEMVKGTLWEAMHSSQPPLNEVKVLKDAPRICFLSGLTGEEIMMFVDAFPEADVGAVVFAALLPNNAQKSIEELMEEIMGDHERLTLNS